MIAFKEGMSKRCVVANHPVAEFIAEIVPKRVVHAIFDEASRL
jgi:hypothetical protein